MVDVVILAVGEGLRDAVTSVPKSMSIVQEKPFLEWLIKGVIKHSDNLVDKIILCIGKNYSIQSHFGQEYEGLDVIYSYESQALGASRITANAVRDHVKTVEFLLINGSFYSDFSLVAMRDDHIHRESGVTVGLAEKQRFNTPKAGFSTDERMRILCYGPNAPYFKYSTPGYYLVDTNVVSYKDSIQPLAVDPGLFFTPTQDSPCWPPSYSDTYGHLMKGPFIDTNTPAEFLTEEFKSL